MLYLSKEEIVNNFSMKEAITACKEAMALYSKGQTSIPLRTNINISEHQGQTLYMPG